MKKTLLEMLQDPRLPVPSSADLSLAVRLLDIYLQEWGKWNRKINLTAEKDPRLVAQNHIFDSLQYLYVVCSDSRVMDIGSGAGFPGLPLKCVFPDLQLALVESQRKRCSFLSSAVRAMGLSAVDVLHCRAEELAGDYLGTWDRVLFRNVDQLDACLERGGPLLKSGGLLVLRKEPGAHQEVQGSPRFGLTFKDQLPVTGWSGRDSMLLVFEKCST